MKRPPPRGLLALIGLLAASLLARPGAPIAAQNADNGDDPLPALFSERLAELEANSLERDAPMGIVAIRQDGEHAYALAQEVDATGAAAGERAFLLLATRDGDHWQTLAPFEPQRDAFNDALDAFPAALLDDASKAYYHAYPPPGAPSARAAAVAGYKLPWPAGQTATVTRKEGHSGGVGQVDFDIQGPNVVGDVYAAKPGTVVFVKAGSNTGGSCSVDWHYANMVVIQHGPAEYSWYVHLRQNSVVVGRGDAVAFGQKIAVEGNTGQACGFGSGSGVHLHFMTSTGHTAFPAEPVAANAAPWATGITTTDFAEAAWANLLVGRSYTSQNGAVVPATPALRPIANGDRDGNYAVTWPSAANATGYKLDEKFNDGDWAGAYTGPDTSKRYAGKAVGTWCYRVRATGPGGTSPWSVAQCTTVVKYRAYLPAFTR